ncbi:MAG TPA: DUF3108 domain-containing protein [Usitatibacter sp.]|nr:DUF3108 domain-containing protein [Usitatibacter sp.]
MARADLIHRYRFLALALLGSAALHAAVMVGMPRRLDAMVGKPDSPYSASLDAAASVMEAPAPDATPAPAKPRTRRAAPLLAPEALLDPIAPETLAAAPVAQPEIAPPEIARPEVVALAQPAVPVKALEPPRFKAEALPADLSITYQLSSAMADGRAVYNWSRDGDSYTITGEAEAVGFFTLFLEGRVLQESRGTVTPTGLRPERFTERKPSMPVEGLEFDWAGRKVTFDRHNEKKTEPLADNVVDWLSMIFQMAAVPPPSGEDYELRVLTQRRYYTFRLKVLGEEEIEIPLGKVRALHLRHVDEKDASEVVDVWLGLDQHYLPVKLRYPVAKNRLTVEQAATRVVGKMRP